MKILQAWSQGINLHSICLEAGYYYPLYMNLGLPVALVYKALGPSPLHALLVIAGLGAATAIPAYSLGRRRGGETGGRAAAVLASWWPSSILWSSQLLRDVPNALALLGAFASLAAIWDPSHAAGRSGWIRRALSWAAFAASLAVITYFRVYMGYIVLITIGIVSAVAGAARVRQGDWRRAARLACPVLLAATTVFTVLAVDWFTLFSARGSRLQAGLHGAAIYGGLPGEAAGDGAGSRPEPPPLAGAGISLATGQPRVWTWGGMAAQANRFAERISLERLEYYRRGTSTSAGHSTIDADVPIDTPRRALAYLPRALAVAFLAPFPWQWAETHGATGVFRMLSAVEMLLVYALMPAVLWGAWSTGRRGSALAWALLVFVIITALALSLTVTNLGILFRLRLQYLLPMAVLAGGLGWPGPYGGLARRYGRRSQGPAVPAHEQEPAGRQVPVLHG
jgi:hypothetical protein